MKYNFYSFKESYPFYVVFENLPVAVILFNDYGEIEQINGAARKLLLGDRNWQAKENKKEIKEKIALYLQKEIQKLKHNQIFEYDFKTIIRTERGNRHLKINLKRINMAQGKEKQIIATLKDVTEEDIAEEFMTRSFDIVKMISQISARFVGIFDLNETMNASLADIGKVSNASRVYIFLFSEDGHKMDNVYEWCGKGISPQIGNLKNLPTKMFPWWMKQLHEGKGIHIKDVAKMPEEAKAEKQVLERQDIKSVMVLPLKIKGEVIGFLGIDHVHEAAKWSSYDLLLLNLASEVFSNVFERKKAEAALMESERKFKELFHNANDAIFLHKAAGNFIMVNSLACKLLGYNKGELLNMGFKQIVVNEQLEEIYAAVKQIETKGSHTFIITLRSQNGAKIPVEINSHIYMMNGEKVIMSIARDIRERRRAEKEIYELNKKLAKEKELLDITLYSIGDGVITTDMQGRVLFLNKVAQKITGWDQEKAIGKPLFEVFRILNWRTGEVLKDPFQRVLQEGTIVGLEKDTVLVDIDDTEKFVSASCAPIKDKSGQMLGGVLVFRDITKIRRTEKKIRMLSCAVEQSPSAVVITDVEGNIEYVNPKFTELTGYSLEEIIGQNPRILKSGKQPPAVYKQLWKTISSGSRWHGEFHNQKKNGDYYWVLASISPIKNQEGQITNYLAVQEDITERKMMEKALERKNEALKEALEKLKFAQVQLIHQEKMAGIGQLAAGVAHEINNPLGFVLSNFETLKKYVMKYKEMVDTYRKFISHCATMDFEDLKSKTENIRALEKRCKIDFIAEDLGDLFNDSAEGLKRITKIVKGLKIFSHIDQQDEFEEYDLNKGIENTLLVANNEIKYYAEIRKNLGAIPFIDAIPSQINQVLLNMIINAAYAIKMKNAGELGCISIATYHDEGFVYCEIEDNGIGIPEENMKHIFNPFFTTKPVGQGTGLGLSISYDIIKNKHKGAIAVSSTFGMGTKFIVKLPTKQDKA